MIYKIVIEHWFDGTIGCHVHGIGGDMRSRVAACAALRKTIEMLEDPNFAALPVERFN